MEIPINSCVSVIGAGGKTSLILSLANKYKKNKTIISTTTKFGINQINNFDYEFNNFSQDIPSGVSFIYKEEDLANNKIIGFSKNIFESFHDYEYLFLECDGSKCKYLKAWNDYEPVIPSNTDITISLLNFKLLNKPINNENIHRLNLFNKMTNTSEGDIINLDILNTICKKMSSLSIGKKYLFINQLDTKDELDLANEFIHKYNIHNYYDLIFIGSLKNNFIEGVVK